MYSHFQLKFILLLLFSFFESTARAESVIGRPLPKWAFSDWLNSKPLSQSELEGKIVLIRWWTAPNCKFCEASAEALKEIHEKYAKRGIIVIGAYHHKSDRPLTKNHVAFHARKLGFTFPIAADKDWETLKSWWREEEFDFTSVSVLLDQKRNVRWVHGGGELSKRSEEFKNLKSIIDGLLREKARPFGGQ